MKKVSVLSLLLCFGVLADADHKKTGQSLQSLIQFELALMDSEDNSRVFLDTPLLEKLKKRLSEISPKDKDIANKKVLRSTDVQKLLDEGVKLDAQEALRLLGALRVTNKQDIDKGLGKKASPEESLRKLIRVEIQKIKKDGESKGDTVVPLPDSLRDKLIARYNKLFPEEKTKNNYLTADQLSKLVAEKNWDKDLLDKADRLALLGALQFDGSQLRGQRFAYDLSKRRRLHTLNNLGLLKSVIAKAPQKPEKQGSPSSLDEIGIPKKSKPIPVPGKDTEAPPLDTPKVKRGTGLSQVNPVPSETPQRLLDFFNRSFRYGTPKTPSRSSRRGKGSGDGVSLNEPIGSRNLSSQDLKALKQAAQKGKKKSGGRLAIPIENQKGGKSNLCRTARVKGAGSCEKGTAVFVTADHCVDGQNQAQIAFGDRDDDGNSEFGSHRVRVEHLAGDMALLHVKDKALACASDEEIPTFPLAKSDQLGGDFGMIADVGHETLVGLASSSSNDPTLKTYNVDNAFTRAGIFPGNSGTPTLTPTKDGKLVITGVVSAKFTDPMFRNRQGLVASRASIQSAQNALARARILGADAVAAASAKSEFRPDPDSHL